MKKAIFIVSAIGLILSFGINTFIHEPEFKDLHKSISYARQTNQLDTITSLYLQLLDDAPLDIDLHHDYIIAHFALPIESESDSGFMVKREDHAIRERYETMSYNETSAIADIGHLGLALIDRKSGAYSKASQALFQVKNQELKYVNTSQGLIYLWKQIPDSAEFHFCKEIEIAGDVKGAYTSIARLLMSQGRFEEVSELCKSSASTVFIPDYIKRKVYFLTGDVFNYMKHAVSRVYSNITFIGFIGALLILCIWVVYIRKLDIYEPEKWRNIALALILGMIFSFGTDSLSDINREIFALKLNGELINDFFYAIVGIGVVEEFVKIIPLLILMSFTNAVNETYDYILYASLSALGFAFVENLIYFNDYQLHIISSRAMMTSIAHMFLSSVVAYAFVLNKYRYQTGSFWRTILFFCLASFGHGFYDFWLINEKAQVFSFISLLFFLSSIGVWNYFKNNALNNSEFYDRSIRLNHQQVSDYLVYSLSGVILFEYLALSLKFGPEIGNKSMIGSLISGVYLIFFISSNLGQFKIRRHKWRVFGDASEPQRFHGDPDEVIRRRVSLNPFSNHELAKYFLPNQGVVLGRYDIHEDYGWYLVKLRKHAKLPGFHTNYVFIKPKRRGKVIRRRPKILVGLYLIKNTVAIESEIFDSKDFQFAHWAKVNTTSILNKWQPERRHWTPHAK